MVAYSVAALTNASTRRAFSASIIGPMSLGGIVARTDTDGGQRLRKPLAEFVCDPGLGEDTTAGHTELPAECSDGFGQNRDDDIQIGVVEHNHRCLAAEFEGQSL